LREFPGDILLIGGKHDAGITLESLQKQALLSPQIRLETLSDSAHMGMFEQTDKALGLIGDFVRQSNQP
jgi:pimeloyl-ACP methyl ester carboxylesterase